MAKAYPEVSPMRELRSALSEMRLSDLAVGADGRNRTILSAFRSRTGRNQPSKVLALPRRQQYMCARHKTSVDNDFQHTNGYAVQRYANKRTRNRGIGLARFVLVTSIKSQNVPRSS